MPNLTGTPAAHAPSGSLAVTTQRARTTGDYEAWSPDRLMRALFKQNVIESLIGLLVLIVAVWFVQFTYQRTERGGRWRWLCC